MLAHAKAKPAMLAHAKAITRHSLHPTHLLSLLGLVRRCRLQPTSLHRHLTHRVIKLAHQPVSNHLPAMLVRAKARPRTPGPRSHYAWHRQPER